MPRRFFRKYLPSHATISGYRYFAKRGEWLTHHNLWHLHRRSVAGGFAVGMFAGLVPGSNPVQFTLAALMAIGFKVNLPIAVIVTLYSNPLTIVPLYYLAFQLGQIALLERGGTLPPLTLSLEGKGWREWFPAAVDWVMALGKPLLVGLPLLAILLSAVGYVAVRMLWRWYVVRKWRQRKRQRLMRNLVP
jgi:uncharacterized protein (DUF2062 family)